MDRTDTVMPAALAPTALYRRADLSTIRFETTADIGAEEGIIGQERAVEAVRFGSRINKPGFNLFVIGAPEARMRATVQAMLNRQAAAEDPPSDWVYINNFAEPHRPVAIALPAGRAPHFRDAMRELIEDLKVALPVAFESEDYQTLRGSIDDSFQKKQADAFAELGARAQGRGLVLIRTPMRFALAPAREGKVVSPEEFNAWDDTKKREVQETTRELEKELERVVRLLPSWEKERRNEVRRLDRDIAARAVSQSIDETRAGFRDLPAVLKHLDAVQADLVDNVATFIGRAGGEEVFAVDPALGGPFARYEVNVLVTCEDAACGAPIIEELHPTLGNLIGLDTLCTGSALAFDVGGMDSAQPDAEPVPQIDHADEQSELYDLGFGKCRLDATISRPY